MGDAVGSLFSTFTVRPPQSPPGLASRRSHGHKSRRTQVSRACERCRLNRVRCDNHARCHNCRKNGLECKREVGSKALTLPVALEEIEKLKAHIAELESRWEGRSAIRSESHIQFNSTAEPQPLDYADSPQGISGPHRILQTETREVRVAVDSSRLDAFFSQPRSFLTDPNLGRLYHSPRLPSAHNLIQRLQAHLHLAYGWKYREEDLHPKAITLNFEQASGACGGGDAAACESMQCSTHGVFMGREQELECLRIFWQSYLCACPVFDLERFLCHHSSLWNNPFRTDNYRDDSPLVDIVLAICIQYGMGHLHDSCAAGTGTADDDHDDVLHSVDPSNAGRWYFQRCHTLLKTHIEKPSILLLQCQLLSVIYLRDASLLNSALSMSAAAIQTAYFMGLHLEESQFLDRHERELSKRLWSLCFALEGKLSMDAGQPFLAQNLGITLPADDYELASSAAELFVPSSKLSITWLTYHVEHVKLIQVAREVYCNISPYATPLFSSRTVDDPSTRAFDEILTHELKKLESWWADVPPSLRYQEEGRREECDSGIPTKDQNHTPLWLRMQGAILALLYHDVIMNLARPVIVFPLLNARPSPSHSSASVNAVECLNHAIAATNIVHRAIGKTEPLHGWHRAYQIQWDAALSMIMFAFSDLCSPYTDTILLELEKVISNLDGFGRCFAIARSARKIVAELRERLRSASVESFKDRAVAAVRVEPGSENSV